MDDKDIFSNSGSVPEPENDFESKFEQEFESESVDELISDVEAEPQNETLDLNSFSSGAVDAARKKKAKQKINKQKILKIALTGVLVCIITFSIVIGSFLLYAFTMVDGTMDVDLNDLKLNFTTTIYVNDKESGEWVEYQRLHGEFNRIWVSYDEKAAKEAASDDKKDAEEGEEEAEYTGIPKMLADAFVAIEDKRFYTHYGVDWKRTFGAVINIFLPIYSSNQGGSTITQQLVKNLTGDDDQNASRKVREIMRARYLETNYTKDTILECYLNTIHLGHGLYGVEVASNYYFGKSVNELTLLECASLASIAKGSSFAPDALDDDGKNIGEKKNKDRRETVLKLMLEEGYISKSEYKEAMDEEFKLVASKDALNETEVNNYFVDALIKEVSSDLADKYGWDASHASSNFYSGGYKIYATLDPNIQNTVDTVFSNAEVYGLKGKDEQQMQGSFTIMDYNGRILGMAGGIGEKDRNLGLNRATDSPRQPGSTMKPIAAYAPAIQNGLITYSSILNDTATNYNGWTPKNWYGGYWGNVTTQRALECSINSIPVYLVNKLGPQKSFDFLTEKLGITTLNKEDVNLAPLGMGGTNGGITTKESAAAYAVFGNGGKYYEPTTYYEVRDQHGNVVLSNKEVKPTIAISEDTATVMNKLLQKVVYGPEGTGAAARGYIPNMKIYAKTGTSNNSNDLWFVGGSPYYVASCWCGFDEQQYIPDQRIALKMWGAVMSEIHKGLEVREFNDSQYVSERYYCTETGLLATDACPAKATGWYTKNVVPKSCGTHVGETLDKVGEETPSEGE